MFEKSKVRSPHVLLTALVFALSLLAACCQEPIDSDIGTDSIHADMRLTCAGDGTTDVAVTLSSSHAVGADLYLTEDDELIATANGESKSLTEKKGWLNNVQHLTTFDFDDPGTEVAIAFERANYEPALNSSVLLPEYLTIETPQPDDAFSRQDTIPLSWTPCGTEGEIEIQFYFVCGSGDETIALSPQFVVSDSGSASYEVADLLSGADDLDADATCTADIVLTRRTTGSISPEFRGGTITAQREDSISVEITP